MDDIKIFLNSTTTIFSLYNNHSNLHHDIFDPFNTIICFAILNFKEEGSKLDLYKNTINVNEKHILQGTMRYIKGNTHINLKLLYEPILHACKFFLLIQCEIDVSSVFTLAVKGLQKLISTYKYNQNITNDLTIYINLIKKTLQKTCEATFLDEILDLSNSNDSNKTMKHNMYSALNTNWTCDKLRIVVSLFSQLDTNNCYDKSNVMTSLQYIVKDINQNTIKLLKLQ